MSKIADATFSGESGSYEFEVYSINTPFNAVGAVYIFTKRTVDPSGRGTHAFLYIGQTESLADRIPNHEKWPCLKRNGTTASACIATIKSNPDSRKKPTSSRRTTPPATISE